MKKCSKCKIEKSLSDFSKDSRAKDRLRSCCKACDAKQNQDYYQDNRTEISEQKRDYYQYNRTERLEYQQGRYQTIRGHLQAVFRSMIYRCYNPECKCYHRYGGRGILVCFASSEEFIDYVVNVLQVDPRGLTIDRIDNKGNYEKGNIRFVSHQENCQNRGKPS